MLIQVKDHCWSREQNRQLLQWAQSLEYRWGEADQPGGRPAGVVRDLVSDQTADLLIACARAQWPQLEQKAVVRSYVNLFMPGEQPQWHRDGAVWTVLAYVTEEREPRLGGGTEFLDMEQKETRSVLPQPSRMVMFDGELWHRATSYPHRERFTVALKFAKTVSV